MLPIVVVRVGRCFSTVSNRSDQQGISEMLVLFLSALLGATPTIAVQSAIKNAVGKELFDPFSARYDWQPVKNEALYCGWVNARNKFGAYTGYQPFMAIYGVNAKSGKAKVLSVQMESYLVTPMCLKEGYRLTR